MRINTFTILCLVLLAVPAALAVKPGEWVHQSEADFTKFELENAVATNLGEIKLARATKQIAELEGDDAIIYDLERIDGRLFAAIGPEGKLAGINGEEVQVVAEFEGAQVFALAADKQQMWVGVSGEASRLELRGGADMAVQRTIEIPDARYIWDIAVRGKLLYVASGVDGKVLQIDTAKDDAQPVAILEVKQSNVLCLGLDDSGRVYAGTDGEGLIYRLTPNGDNYTTFVLYDAPEPEIGALLVSADGTLFAGTAEANQARPGRLEKARTEPRGRPEPQPTEPSDLPNVPPKPAPTDSAKKAPEPPAAAQPAEPKPAETPPPAEPDTALAQAQPTPEQYDRLREAIRARLDEAQKSGAIRLQSGPPTTSRPSPSRSGPRPSSGSRSTRPRGAKDGNAVYRISPDGFVQEVFRESVMILKLARIGEALLVATGNEGQLYRVDPDAEEVTILADLEPEQAPALLADGNGAVLVGTANPGHIIRLADSYAVSGTVTSDALDAGQISLWGRLQVLALAPPGTSLEVQTRAGNLSDPEEGFWSEWSAPQQLAFNGGRSAFVNVASPTARFIQYRLTLRSDGQVSPTIDHVSIKYLLPNLRPTVTSIKAEYVQPKRRSGEEEAVPQQVQTLKVEWEASDENKDKLKYTLAARLFESDGPFVVIAEDLDANNFEWDTRTTADGRYLLRVTASDAADNVPEQARTASRRSDPVVIDNNAPLFENVQFRPNGTSVEISAVIVDELSPIADLRYAVDSSKDWILVLPDDLIYDSTRESVVLTIRDLSPGAHVVTLRATDSLGNSRYLSRTVTVR